MDIFSPFFLLVFYVLDFCGLECTLVVGHQTRETEGEGFALANNLFGCLELKLFFSVTFFCLTNCFPESVS
jgi:hypothetical protein